MTTQALYPAPLADQREYFDRLITQEWDTYDNSTWDYVRALEIRQLFRHIRPRRILDVGCGCGYHDLLMARQALVDRVTGIDYSQASIAAANRAYPHPRVERHVADIFSLDRGDFDLVVSFQVIEHIPDASAFLAACVKFVTPGGWLAIITPNRDRAWNQVRRLWRLPPAVVDPQHFREYTIDELSKCAEGHGLRRRYVFGHGLSLYVPKLGREVVPTHLGILGGNLFPPLADVIGILFQKPARAG